MADITGTFHAGKKQDGPTGFPYPLPKKKVPVLTQDITETRLFDFVNVLDLFS